METFSCSCELGKQSRDVRQQSEYEGLGPATNFSGASLVHHLLNGKVEMPALAAPLFSIYALSTSTCNASQRGSIDEASGL